MHYKDGFNKLAAYTIVADMTKLYLNYDECDLYIIFRRSEILIEDLLRAKSYLASVVTDIFKSQEVIYTIEMSKNKLIASVGGIRSDQISDIQTKIENDSRVQLF